MSARPCFKLGQHVADVIRRGVVGDKKGACNLSIGESFRREAQDFGLTTGERPGVLRATLAASGDDRSIESASIGIKGDLFACIAALFGKDRRQG